MGLLVAALVRRACYSPGLWKAITAFCLSRREAAVAHREKAPAHEVLEVLL
jgi:hypothetical protein